MREYREMDFLPPEEIEDIQFRLLAEVVERVHEKSPYYRKVFGEMGLVPSDIGSLDDLKKLPVTDRDALQKETWDFLTVPDDEVVEKVSTTGTTGEPAFIALTGEDLERLGYNEERSFSYIGTGRRDSFHIAVTSDNLFIAGMAYYRGLTRLGASVVRVGPQNMVRHIDLLKKLKPTGMVAVPSFMAHLIRHAKERGIDPGGLGIEKLVLIGDSIRDEDFSSNALGRMIEGAFGDVCYSTYGLTEAQGSFCECVYRQGLHSHPDLVLAEVLGEDGRVLGDGEVGELVLTMLQVEGMPLVRYRTGDMTFKVSGRCPCGRNSARIGPIVSRKHHRMKVKGVTLYPKAIENAILGIEDVHNYQINAYTGQDGTDRVLLRVGSYRDDHGFRTALRETVKAKARITPEIEIEKPEDLRGRLFENGSRKPITFKDSRNGPYRHEN